jgi:hypothetical protein
LLIGRLAKPGHKFISDRTFNYGTANSVSGLLKIRKFIETFKLLWDTAPSLTPSMNIMNATTKSSLLATLWSRQGIPTTKYKQREQSLGEISQLLLCNLKCGLDVPLHCVVPVLLDKVVIGMADILCLLFGLFGPRGTPQSMVTAANAMSAMYD